MPIFSPPGNVKDLPAAGQQGWSNKVQEYFSSSKAGRPSFFSPFDVPGGQTPASRLIPWNGFPKKYSTIVNPDPMYRYKAVEEPVTQGLQGEDYSAVYSTANRKIDTSFYGF